MHDPSRVNVRIYVFSLQIGLVESLVGLDYDKYLVHLHCRLDSLENQANPIML